MMKNLKIYDKNLRKKVGTIALSFVLGITSIGFNGCSKEKEKETTSNEIVYTVEKDDEQLEYEKDTRVLGYPLSQNVTLKSNDTAEYNRYIDLNKLSDLDLENVNILDLNNTSDDNYLIDYIYTVRDGGYTNTYMPSKKMKEFIKEGINYDNYFKEDDSYKRK